MGRCRENLDAIATAVDDRQQPPGIGGGVLDVTDAWMGREPRNDLDRQIRALKIWIGIDHDGNVDGVGDRAKISFHLSVLQREIRFQDREDAVGSELLIFLGLNHRIGCRCRGDTCHNRYAAPGRLDRRLHDPRTLEVVEIGELTGRAQRG